MFTYSNCLVTASWTDITVLMHNEYEPEFNHWCSCLVSAGWHKNIYTISILEEDVQGERPPRCDLRLRRNATCQFPCLGHCDPLCDAEKSPEWRCGSTFHSFFISIAMAILDNYTCLNLFSRILPQSKHGQIWFIESDTSDACFLFYIHRNCYSQF